MYVFFLFHDSKSVKPRALTFPRASFGMTYMALRIMRNAFQYNAIGNAMELKVVHKKRNLSSLGGENLIYAFGP